MAVQLILLRHAHSQQDYKPHLDFYRNLTKKGYCDICSIAENQAINLADLECIYCSHSVRTVETSFALLQNINPKNWPKTIIKEMIYTDNSLETYFKIISEVPSKFSRVLIVGHNPGLSNFISYLWPEFPGRFPTSGLVYIAASSWKSLLKSDGIIEKFVFNDRKKELEKNYMRFLKQV